jgi:hypothetical protein
LPRKTMVSPVNEYSWNPCTVNCSKNKLTSNNLFQRYLEEGNFAGSQRYQKCVWKIMSIDQDCQIDEIVNIYAWYHARHWFQWRDSLEKES